MTRSRFWDKWVNDLGTFLKKRTNNQNLQYPWKKNAYKPWISGNKKVRFSTRNSTQNSNQNSTQTSNRNSNISNRPSNRKPKAKPFTPIPSVTDQLRRLQRCDPNNCSKGCVGVAKCFCMKCDVCKDQPWLRTQKMHFKEFTVRNSATGKVMPLEMFYTYLTGEKCDNNDVVSKDMVKYKFDFEMRLRLLKQLQLCTSNYDQWKKDSFEVRVCRAIAEDTEIPELKKSFSSKSTKKLFHRVGDIHGASFDPPKNESPSKTKPVGKIAIGSKLSSNDFIKPTRTEKPRSKKVDIGIDYSDPIYEQRLRAYVENVIDHGQKAADIVVPKELRPDLVYNCMIDTLDDLSPKRLLQLLNEKNIYQGANWCHNFAFSNLMRNVIKESAESAWHSVAEMKSFLSLGNNLSRQKWAKRAIEIMNGTILNKDGSVFNKDTIDSSYDPRSTSELSTDSEQMLRESDDREKARIYTKTRKKIFNIAGGLSVKIPNNSPKPEKTEKPTVSILDLKSVLKKEYAPEKLHLESLEKTSNEVAVATIRMTKDIFDSAGLERNDDKEDSFEVVDDEEYDLMCKGELASPFLADTDKNIINVDGQAEVEETSAGSKDLFDEKSGEIKADLKKIAAGDPLASYNRLSRRLLPDWPNVYMMENTPIGICAVCDTDMTLPHIPTKRPGLLRCARCSSQAHVPSYITTKGNIIAVDTNKYTNGSKPFADPKAFVVCFCRFSDDDECDCYKGNKSECSQCYIGPSIAHALSPSHFRIGALGYVPTEKELYGKSIVNGSLTEGTGYRQRDYLFHHFFPDDGTQAWATKVAFMNSKKFRGLPAGDYLHRRGVMIDQYKMLLKEKMHGYKNQMIFVQSSDDNFLTPEMIFGPKEKWDIDDSPAIRIG